MIKVRHLTKRFSMGTSVINALDHISFDIDANELVAIMGPSGSGKSTLMNILGCLTTPDEGTYSLHNREIGRLDDDALAAVRCQDIGFVFQSFNLLNRRNALQNVMLGLRFSDIPKTQWLSRTTSMLQRVGLGDRLEHTPAQLSGGERQRVAIARALVNQPRILLADEPTGNLDSATTHEIMALFTELHDKGQTVILVTHDNEIANYARRVIYLHDGRISRIEKNDSPRT